MRIKKYYSFIITLFISAALLFTGCSLLNSTDNNSDTSTTSQGMKVHYIDVGQGDSILIQADGKNLLIDAGPTDSTKKLLAYLQKQHIKRLDYVIATHPHEDHIGGMADVVKKYDIGEFYMPKKLTDTKVFENMINALKSKSIKAVAAKAGMSFSLGKNAECSIIAPNSSNYDSLNNYSVVLMIKYGNSRFLFMGDAEKLSEKEILSKGFDVNSDVLKVGHHGSTSSSSKDFLDKASPKIAVISCGKNNDYGHPHKETLQELKKRNIQVYRTDIDGSIVLYSDGQNISKQ